MKMPRYSQYFQIYDASTKFDPENVSIVKSLDKKTKLAHLTIEISKFFYIFVFSNFFKRFLEIFNFLIFMSKSKLKLN